MRKTKVYSFNDFKLGIVYTNCFGYNWLDKNGGYCYMTNDKMLYYYPTGKIHSDKEFEEYSTLSEFVLRMSLNLFY